MVIHQFFTILYCTFLHFTKKCCILELSQNMQAYVILLYFTVYYFTLLEKGFVVKGKPADSFDTLYYTLHSRSFCKISLLHCIQTKQVQVLALKKSYFILLYYTLLYFTQKLLCVKGNSKASNMA